MLSQQPSSPPQPEEEQREQLETIEVLKKLHENIDEIVEEDKIANIIKELREKPYAKRQIPAIEAQIDVITDLLQTIEHFKKREKLYNVDRSHTKDLLKVEIGNEVYKCLVRSLGYSESKYKKSKDKGKVAVAPDPELLKESQTLYENILEEKKGKRDE